MATRVRFRRFYECDTEAERSLDIADDSIIYCLDTSKYYKVYLGAFVEIPLDEVVFTSPIAVSKLAVGGIPDGTKFLRDDGVWDNPPGTAGASIGFEQHFLTMGG